MKRTGPLWLHKFLRSRRDEVRPRRGPYPGGRKPKNPAARILVVANGGIGNAIQATPLVQALRTLWPKAYLVFLTPRGSLFQGWDAVDAVIQEMAEAASLGPFDKTFVTFGASLGAEWPVIIADGNYGEVVMPREPLNQPFQQAEWDCYVGLARANGFVGVAPPYYVSMAQPNFELPGGRPLVCLVPGSKPEFLWRHKRWPYFGELAKLLLTRFPRMKLLVLGTPEDIVQDSLLKLEGVLDVRGKFTLAETAWVLKQADLVIGNDCGPIHIADAVLAEHLVLFGPSCTVKNGPRNRGWPVRVPTPCSPCQYDHQIMAACPRAICMDGITPEIVLSRAEKILCGHGF